jgi:hypothetical protein
MNLEFNVSAFEKIKTFLILGQREQPEVQGESIALGGS